MRKLLFLVLFVLPAVGVAVDYSFTWDPVVDDRLTGYELFVAPRDDAFPSDPAWAGSEERTTPIEFAENAWYKAHVRAVGEQNGDVIYSLPSDELQWYATEQNIIIMLPSVTGIRFGE